MHDESNVGRWLLLLRDGAEAEQQLARTELGLILEARGLLDEAAEAFERNVADGTPDRRPYERLAAIARLRGDTAGEARVLRGLAELLSPSPLPPAPAPAVREPEAEPDYPLPAFLAASGRAEQDERAEAADEAADSADASDGETLAPSPAPDDFDEPTGTSESIATVSPLPASLEDSADAAALAAEDEVVTAAEEPVLDEPPADADAPTDEGAAGASAVVDEPDQADELDQPAESDAPAESTEVAATEESTPELVAATQSLAASDDANGLPVAGESPSSEEPSTDSDEAVADPDAAVTDPDASAARDAPDARTIEDDALPATDAAAAPTDDAPETASADVPAAAVTDEPSNDAAVAAAATIILTPDSVPVDDQPAADATAAAPSSDESDAATAPDSPLGVTDAVAIDSKPNRGDSEMQPTDTDRWPVTPVSDAPRDAAGLPAETQVIRPPAETVVTAAPAETLVISAPAGAESEPSKPAFWRWVPTLIGLVLVILVVGGALMVPVSRPLSVTPAKPGPSPTAIQQQLLAAPATVQPSPSPSPSPAAAMVAASPVPSPVAVAAPLPAGCADAALRFPETQASEAAVRAAFREYLTRQGVTNDVSSPEFRGRGEAYAARHGEVLAGWMAVTLQRERRGLPTFPLVDYVASDIIVAAGPGEFQLRATVSPQGWNELRALPADSCEGAFLKSPENARWVELMQASVGDITWALPTPQPRR